jgi:hypothetical protein
MFWKVLFSYCLEIKIYKKINWIFCFENKKIYSKIISCMNLILCICLNFFQRNTFLSLLINAKNLLVKT